MSATKLPVGMLLGLAAAAAVGLYVWRKGGVQQAAAGAGAAVVEAAGGAASGAVGAVGAAVGLPTPSDTTTDAAVARWIIDNRGYFEASKWAGVPALVKAMTLDSSEGRAPDPASAAGKALGVGTPPQAAGQTASATQPAGWDYSGKTFDELSRPDGWWPYGAGFPLGPISGG
ncbi:MAG: hypothetical protein KBC73_05530 [Burkholderiaceae bacterium]|nr:hypothetical protein [Burkholderiaceae bacterium]